MNDKNKLLKMIQTYSFALNETALYLDAHPNCRSALRHYKNYRDKLVEATRLYEEKFGMISICGANSYEHWQWVNEPWPWEN